MARIFLLLVIGAVSLKAAPAATLSEQLRRFWANDVRLEIENFPVKDYPVGSFTVESVQPTPPAGLVSVTLLVRKGNKTERRYANVNVRVFAKVAIVKSPLRHGDGFSEDNVFFDEREVSAYTLRGTYSDLKQLASLRVQGNLRPGQIVTSAQTQVPFAVTFGQSVQLTHRQGSLSLQARVKALENGRLNDWIRVENPSSKKILVARITGPSEVQTR